MGKEMNYYKIVKHVASSDKELEDIEVALERYSHDGYDVKTMTTTMVGKNTHFMFVLTRPSVDEKPKPAKKTTAKKSASAMKTIDLASTNI